MPSEYDALLAPPKASPYDALLTPKASPYDALLTAPAQPQSPLGDTMTAKELQGFLKPADPNALSPQVGEPLAFENPNVQTKDQMTAALNDPLITLPKPDNTGIVSGVTRGLETLGEGLTSPVNIGLIASIGGAPAAFRTAATTAFRAMMIKYGAGHIAEALQEDEPGKIAEKLTTGIGEGAMGLIPEGRPEVERPASLPQKEIDAAIRTAPEPAPNSAIDDPTLDGLVMAKDKAQSASSEMPESKPLSQTAGYLQWQLKNVPADRITESRDRIAQQAAPTPPEAPEGQGIEAPPASGETGTAGSFQQAVAEKAAQGSPAPVTAAAAEEPLSPAAEEPPTLGGAKAGTGAAGEEPKKSYLEMQIEAGRRLLPFGETAINDPDAAFASGSKDYHENSMAFSALSRAVGVRRALDISSGKEPYPTREQFEKGVENSFYHDASELRNKVLNELRSIGVDPKKTNLPNFDDFKTAKEFYDAMADADSRMRKSGASLASAMGFKVPKEEVKTAQSEPQLALEPTAVPKSDWTSATEEAPPTQMKRGGGETGAIDLPKFADRKMSELDEATTLRSAKMQKSFQEAERAKTEIERVAPTTKRQNAISVWMEANGDAAKLQSWEAGAKGDVFKRAVKDAQTLTPEEIAIAQKAKTAFDVLGKRGARYDVLGSFRDSYVPHVWDTEQSAGIGARRLQEKFKFSKARTFENFAEGDAAGFKPKTLAIGKLLPAYLSEMNKVIADRQFVQDLGTRAAEDGRPSYTPRGRISAIEPESGGKAYLVNPDAIKGLKDEQGNPVDTSDYRVMEGHPALHDWLWEGKDEKGNPIFMRDDLAVHPDVAKRIEAMMGKSTLPIPKWIDKSQAVMKREMFGLLAPFHQVQEGTHAIAHRVNPFFGLEPVDMRQPKFMDAAQHGLMLLPDRATAAGYMEGLGGKGTFLTQALRFLGEKNEGVAGKMATTMANVVDGYQNYLFHKYIPALKFKTYEAILGRNMDVYAKELKSGQMSEADVKLTSAEQTNAAYGHLNRDLLDRQPNTQHFLQLAFLAPDFMEARGRFVAQAAKGLLGSKVGREQFVALAFIAAVQAGAAYVTTKLTGGQYDPKKPFSVMHGDREYTMRSVPEDLLRFGGDIYGQVRGGDKGMPFISARINPLLQSIHQAITGINYRGEKTSFADTAEELLAKYIPITAQSIPGIRSLTETSRNSPVSPLEQLAGSMGLKISRHSPITETYSKASQWMDANKIPRDKGSYPVSKYQQLRYALEDGDMDKAKTEYGKLLKTESRYAVARGFPESLEHPFTKNAQTDAKFRGSLNASDRLVYDQAVRSRREILNRFHAVRP